MAQILGQRLLCPVTPVVQVLKFMSLTPTLSAAMHSVTDGQTDRQTTVT